MDKEKDFTANAVASAVDVLSMANYVSGQKLYEWYSLSSDGGSVEGAPGSAADW